VATVCEQVSRTAMRRVDPAWLSGWLAALVEHVQRASAAGVRAALAEMHAAPEMESVRSAAVLR